MFRFLLGFSDISGVYGEKEENVEKRGSADVRIGERTSTLGLISLSPLWVHGGQVIGLDPVQGNPTSPTSHCPFRCFTPTTFGHRLNTHKYS